jgi:DHA1 family inner membrane transport protein
MAVESSPSSATGADDPRRWFPILVLAAAGFSLGADLYMLPAVVPAIARDLHLPVSVAAQMLTIYGALVAVAAPLATVLTRNVDRRLLLLASVALLAVTNLLTAVTPDLPLLFGTRVLAAVAAAILAPIRTATAGQLAPGNARARAVGIATAGLSAALVVGGPLGLAAAVTLGWRAAFVGSAAVALVVLVAIFVSVPSVPAPRRSNLGEQIAILRHGSLLVSLLSNVAALCAIYVLLPFLVPVIQHLTSFGGAGVAVTFALYGASGTVGNWAAGWAADRLGTIPVMIGGLLLSALAMVLLSLLFMGGAPFGAGVVLPVLIVLWGLGSWSYYALLFARLIELAPHAPAAALSWSSPATFAGVSLGASLGGLTLQGLSMSWLGWVAAALFLLAGVMVLAARGSAQPNALGESRA